MGSKLIQVLTSLLFVYSVSGRSLPTGSIIQAYVDIVLPTTAASNQVFAACQNRVNVLTWSFIELSVSKNKAAITTHSQNGGTVSFPNIATLANRLKTANLSTTHLVSIGGWGITHPTVSTTLNGAAYYAAWKTWNNGLNTSYGFSFDGIDWDYEGENTVSGPNNVININLQDMMGNMSTLAKADGYVVTIVPAQSYLDYEQSNFSILLNHSDSWAPTFLYHGWNAYAYLWQKYNASIDAVLLQVYEGWSRAGYDISVTKDVGTYFTNLVSNMTTGWTVKFSQVSATQLPDTVVSIPPSKLIMALANGFGGAVPEQAPNYPDQKFPIFWAQDIQPSWDPTKYRGFGFWELQFEGTNLSRYNTTSNTSYTYSLYLAKDLNAFVHAR